MKNNLFNRIFTEKVKKVLSSILILLNPEFGCGGISLAIACHWYYILLIGYIPLSLMWYFKTHKDEFAEDNKKFEEFKATHTYIGKNYYHTEFWKNNKTGEITEIEDDKLCY